MKKIIVIFFGALLPLALGAQRPMKKNELGPDYFLADVKILDGKMFAVKYQGACIGYSKKSKEFLLYGDANGTDIIFLEKIPGIPLRFTPERFVSCTYTGGKIYLASKLPNKATIVTGVFKWEDEHVVWEKEETFDLSELQVKRAQELVKNLKVAEAIVTYDSVEFAETYYDIKKTGIELLITSVKIIEANTGKRK